MQIDENNEVSQIPFGVFELDATGVVLHYSPALEGKRNGFTNSIVGRNFFSDLVSSAQIAELKGRFLSFMANGDSVERFTIRFPYNQNGVKVQIVMARLTEKSEWGRERFAIVRLMPDAHAIASSIADA